MKKTQIKNSKLSLHAYSFFVIVFLLSLSLFVVQTTHAASLYVADAPAILDSSTDFYLDFILDTQGQTLNAIEAAISYPDDLLEMVAIYNGKTVVTSWLVSPQQDGSSIQFAGVMAGGFKEVTDPLENEPLPGNLFRVVFSPLVEGSGSISFENAHAYLHDGKGTEATLYTTSFPFTLQPGGEKTQEIIIDSVGPDAFVPLISQSENVFAGKYFLVFETRDLATGVAYYEVKEGSGGWMLAESPYPLLDQTLKKKIRIRAVDNAGNSTVATLGEGRSHYFFVINVIAVLLIAGFIFTKRIIRKNKMQSSDHRA